MGPGVFARRVPSAAVLTTLALLLGFAGIGCGGVSPVAPTSGHSSVVTPSSSATGTSVADATTVRTNPFTAIKATSSTTPDGAGSSGSATTSQSTTTIGDSDTTSGSAATTVTSATTTYVSTTTTAVAMATTTTAKATTTTAKATTTTAKATTTTAKATTTTVGVVVLQVTGLSGTKSFTMAQLKSMAAVQGYGGFKNQLGTITAPAVLKGVSVPTLLATVGGLPSGHSLRVTASDGYTMTFSYGQVEHGDFTMFDPSTGDEITHISGSLQMIVAYSKNGIALGADEGPLRLALVSAQSDQLTPSASWVKYVAKIELE